MNIRYTHILKLFLWFGLLIAILSPSLSNLIGLPRLDSAFGGLFLLISIFTLFYIKFEKNFLKLLLPLYGILFFGFLSVISDFSTEKIVDLFFFGILVFIFQYTFLVCRTVDDEDEIKQLVMGVSLIVLMGFFIEAGLGLQLVSGNEELTVSDNAFKGFFFNTNDQATVMISLAAAIGFFFIVRENNFKSKCIGYSLLLLIGVVIVMSASRSVLASYLIMMALLLFLNASIYFKAIYTLLGFVIVIFIFNLSWLQEIFLQLSKIEWLERPIERFALAIFSMDDDKSVGYRTEIYTTFLQNFKVLWLGYGPRDYATYFDEIKLSFPLGYTNPHSFFIEVYLAFGLLGFLSLVVFLLMAIISVVNSRLLILKEKIFALFIIINFCWVVWVPSSILRLPLVWYPVFLVLIFMVLSRCHIIRK